jgi:hypothetical protein
MTDDEKRMGKQMLGKLMLKMLKHASINVPQPLPLIEEKAKQRLSTDGLISWKIILKEWEKISQSDKQAIAKLLVLNSHDLVEVFDIEKWFLEEHKATAEYVNQHPEWGRSKEDIQASMLTDSFEDLFD